MLAGALAIIDVAPFGAKFANDLAGTLPDVEKDLARTAWRKIWRRDKRCAK